MEIERKFLISELPFSLEDYPFHLIEQAYLNASPVIRIRREDERFYLTYKSGGLMVREEYNLPLTREAYDHLLPKADGNIITKKRFLIPPGNGKPGKLLLLSAEQLSEMDAEAEISQEHGESMLEMMICLKGR